MLDKTKNMAITIINTGVRGFNLEIHILLNLDKPSVSSHHCKAQ